MSRTPDNLRGKTPAQPAGAGNSPPAPPPKTEDGQSGMRTGRILWYRRTRIEPREDIMGQRIFQVDAFTDRPFAGNPAGVCILETARDDAWMQQVAREMNISETAFLERRDDAFDLRWFTPTVEVDLCGHATLASAHVLWQEGHLAPDEPARFHTRSGLLEARRTDDWIEIGFAAYAPRPLDPPLALVEALGVAPKAAARFEIGYLLAAVDSEDAVRGLDPDLALLATLPDLVVCVTSRASTPGYDFVSRTFAPNAGIPEDPVTGSTHCCLGPFWRPRLGKDEFTAYQASDRGGVLRVRL